MFTHINNFVENIMYNCSSIFSLFSVSPFEILALCSQVKDVSSKLADCERLINDLKRQLDNLNEANTQLHLQLKNAMIDHSFSIERICDSKIKGLLRYYTGFESAEFNSLCDVLKVPLINEPQVSPLSYVSRTKSAKLPLRVQLFIVLCKLRNNFDTKDLAFRFGINQPDVCILFNSWINYMFQQLGSISIWPHRSVIQSIMPVAYRNDFPNTLAILDCTELKIQKPSCLKLQSQCFSDYKSTTTLKILVVCDPIGSVMFASALQTGAMSDKEIFERSGLKQQLKRLIQCGYVNVGDGLMSDKGFNVVGEVEDIGLHLNLPPFAKSGCQMPMHNVEMTKKIAKHRVHVERCIGKIKTFKILSGRIRNATLASVDQIWLVCCLLTNFQPPLFSRAI